MDSITTAHVDIRAWLRLTHVPGITPRAQRTLLKAFGSAEALVDAPTASVAAHVGEDIVRLLEKGPSDALVDATLRWLARPGCHLLTITDPRYPQMLKEISCPPAVLYAQGRLDLLQNCAFAIVGSRNATHQGLEDAHAFAHALSQSGLTIVSGLALGIDAAAHRGGLAGKSSSIAVMGTGPDRIYPRRNEELAHMLANEGCLLSEFPMGMRSLPRNFPRRNRLISGLSRGVLVVEAGIPSGSLSTALRALEQDRDVFAIPGSIHSSLSKGCHWLIKEGAKLVEGADDSPRCRRSGPRRDGVRAGHHGPAHAANRTGRCYTRRPTRPSRDRGERRGAPRRTVPAHRQARYRMKREGPA